MYFLFKRSSGVVTARKCVYLSFPTYNEQGSTSREGKFAELGFHMSGKKIICTARIPRKVFQVWQMGWNININAVFLLSSAKWYITFFSSILRYRTYILLKERKITPLTMKFTKVHFAVCQRRNDGVCLKQTFGKAFSLLFSPDYFMREIKGRKRHEQHVSQNLNWGLFLLLQPITRLYLSWNVAILFSHDRSHYRCLPFKSIFPMGHLHCLWVYIMPVASYLLIIKSMMKSTVLNTNKSTSALLKCFVTVFCNS